MNALTRFLAPAACVVGLAAPPAAHAGGFHRPDDCAPNTRHARAEVEAELCNARRFESLDCRGLAAYAESYRRGINQRIAATSYRPVAESAPDRSPLPQLRSNPAPVPSELPPAEAIPPAAPDRRQSPSR